MYGASHRTGIRIRRLVPEDLDAIRRSLLELSRETLYRRFLRVVPASRVDLSWVAELGGSRHVAFGACTAGAGDPMGLARAVVETGRAELAVTVIDRWQGQGVGTALTLVLLSELRARGVGVVVGTVGYENRAALALCHRLGARSTGPVEGGVIELSGALRADAPALTATGGPSADLFDAVGEAAAAYVKPSCSTRREPLG